MADRIYLVMGVTGKQGTGVASAFLDRRLKVRGTTRDINSMKANRCRAQGIEMVLINDLAKAFAGCYGLFFLMTMDENRLPINEQVALGKKYIDTALDAGIKHIVYSSIANNDIYDTIFPAKYDIQLYLEDQAEQKGFLYSVVRPTHIFENMTWDSNSVRFESEHWPRSIKLPWDPYNRLWHIAARDIGKVVLECFLNPGKYNGRVIDLGGANITGSEILSEMNKQWRMSENDAISWRTWPPLCILECVTACCCCFSCAEGIGRLQPFYNFSNDSNYIIDLPKLKEEFPFIMNTEEWVASLPKAYRR